MSETPNLSRPERTPAEINSQVTRIAGMLATRAEKLTKPEYGQKPAVGEAVVDHYPGSDALKARIISTKRPTVAKEVRTEWSDGLQESVAPTDKGPRFVDQPTSKHNTVSRTIEVTDDEGKRSTETMKVSISDSGAKGILVKTGEGGYPITSDLHPDNGVELLSKLRGDIAAQEIAGQTTQARADELLKL